MGESAPTVHPWDQRPGESPEAYARFLTYRNLGPGRTLPLAESTHRGARKGTKKHASGQWAEESARFEWVARAVAWDIHHLQEHGTELVRLWLGILVAAAKKAAEALADPKCTPQSFSQAVAVADKLVPYMTPDVLRATQPPADAPAVKPREPDRASVE